VQLTNENKQLFFHTEYAIKYGLDAAVLIQNFQFWINLNAKSGKNFHEGKTWSFICQKELQAKFPFWSERQIQIIISKLVKAKILLVKKLHKNRFDRTNWYAFADEGEFSITPNSVMLTPNGVI
jgi:hypothetical protein